MTAHAPWTAHYEPGVPATVSVPSGPFHHIATAAAAGAPTFPALEFFGRRLSYAELDAAAEQVAARLASMPGFEPGARLLVDLPNGWHLVKAALGAWRAGAVVVPVAGLTSQGLARASSGAVAAIVGLGRTGRWAQVPAAQRPPLVPADPAADLPLTLRLVYRASRHRPQALPGATAWRALLAQRVPRPEFSVPETAPALAIPGPDGSDSAVYSHRQLVAGATLIRAWLTDAFLGDDTWLVLADLSTPLALTAILGTALGMRAHVILVPRGDGREALRALRYTRPAYVLADGETIRHLAEEPAAARLDLEQTRAILVGEALHPALTRAFSEITGVEACVGYAPAGMCGLATCNPINAHRVAGSIGLPLPSVGARVMAADGRPARPGEAGVLEVSGPHGPPGWLRTGLLVRPDSQGFLHLAGTPDPAPAASTTPSRATEPAGITAS